MADSVLPSIINLLLSVLIQKPSSPNLSLNIFLKIIPSFKLFSLVTCTSKLKISFDTFSNSLIELLIISPDKSVYIFLKNFISLYIFFPL